MAEENKIVKATNLVNDSTIQTLDKIKQKTPDGIDYWLARDLQLVLGYAQWRNFESAIERAKIACESVGSNPRYHFADTSKVITTGKGAKQTVEDVALTRLASYLVAMNGDPRIPEIAIAQNYFAIQTRKQEIADQKNELEERIELRDRVTLSVKELNKVAQESGVQRYGLFTDAGYRGLYGEIGLKEIKAKKKINEKEQLFDRITSQELAANYFKNTQAEARLRREQVKEEDIAIHVHHDTAKEVRNTIEKLGGSMPEALPAQPSLKQVTKAKGQTKQLH